MIARITHKTQENFVLTGLLVIIKGYNSGTTRWTEARGKVCGRGPGGFGISGDTFTVEGRAFGQKPHLEHSAACAGETSPPCVSDFLLASQL